MTTRTYWLSLILTMAGISSAAWSVEPPKEPPRPDPALQKHLDPLLENWAKAAKDLESMHVAFKCVREDPNFKDKKTLDGTAKFLRIEGGGYKAYMELRPKPEDKRPEDYEKVLYTGNYLYVFTGATGIIDVYPVDPKQAARPPDEGPLALLFGMDAKAAKERYDITVKKVDEWYTYLDVKPNFPKDKAEFLWAEVAIYNKKTDKVPQYMPARISFIEPNKRQTTWTVSILERNNPDAVLPQHFVAPREKELPKGWKMEVHKAEAVKPK